MPNDLLIYHLKRTGKQFPEIHEILQRGNKEEITLLLKRGCVATSTIEKLLDELLLPAPPPEPIKPDPLTLVYENPNPKLYNPHDFVVVSFYTPEYREIVKFLRASLEWLGLDYDLVEVPLKGTWREITWYKPKFILEMIKKHNKPVFWVDADAAFIRYPTELHNIKNDFVISWTEGIQFESKILKQFVKEKLTYHSGSIFVQNNGEKIIKEWLELKDYWMDLVPDQYVINMAVAKHPNLTGLLSFDYLNTVHINHNGGPMITTDNPAVLHFIYSDLTDDERTVSKVNKCLLFDFLSNNGKENAIKLLQYKNSVPCPIITPHRRGK